MTTQYSYIFNFFIFFVQNCTIVERFVLLALQNGGHVYNGCVERFKIDVIKGNYPIVFLFANKVKHLGKVLLALLDENVDYKARKTIIFTAACHHVS
jgi:hypothetical protein